MNGRSIFVGPMLVACLAGFAAAQTVLLQEEFNTSPTSRGWTISSGGSTADTWVQTPGNYTNGGGSSIGTLDGTGFMIVDSDGAGSAVTMAGETLTSPAVDTTAKTGTLWLVFDHFYRHLGSSGTVQVFDGATWQTLATFTADIGAFGAPASAEINIDVYSNASLQVRFVYQDGTSWAWWWCVDNFVVEDRPIPNQTVLDEEDFDTDPTSRGWTITSGGSTVDTWVQTAGNYTNAGGSSIGTLDGTGFMIVDSDAAGSAVTMVETLTSPAIDTTSKSGTLFLIFDHHYEHLGSSGTVQVFNGSAWQTVATFTATVGDFSSPANVEINIDAHSNANLQVRFVYSDGTSWAWWWCLDNYAIVDRMLQPEVDITASSVLRTRAPGARLADLGLFTFDVIGPPQTIDDLTMTIEGTAIDADFDQVQIWLDDGDGLFEPEGDDGPALGTSVPSGGSVTFANVGIAIVTGDAIWVSADISYLTPDGTEIAVSIDSGSDLSLTPGASFAAAFPVATDEHFVFAPTAPEETFDFSDFPPGFPGGFVASQTVRGGGNMFNIVTGNTAVTLDSVEVACFIPAGAAIGTTDSISIYFRPGTFVGFQTNAAAWTRAGGRTWTRAFAGVASQFVSVAANQTKIVVPPHSVYGIYVNAWTIYTSGAFVFPNGIFTSQTGSALTGTFSGLINNRSINCRLHFSYTDSYIEPPLAPDGQSGVSYSHGFSAITHPQTTVEFSTDPSDLPPGLTLTPAGLLSGLPTSAGVFTGTVFVSDGGLPFGSQPFDITISSGAAQPFIAVREAGGAPISNGATASGNRAFGNRDVVAGPSSALTIEVVNQGSADLHLGIPRLQPGTAVDSFIIDASSFTPTVAAGTSTSFTIAFDPTVQGALASVVEITHDDVTTADPFTFGVAGSGTNPNTVAIFEEVSELPVSDTVNVGNGPGVTVATILVSGAPTAPDVFAMEFALDHTWLGDLDIELVTPGGTTLTVISSDGGFSGENFSHTTVTGSNDAFFTAVGSMGALNAADAPFTDVYTAEGDSGWNAQYGVDPNGTWTLIITDNLSGDHGLLLGWALYFDDTSQSSINETILREPNRTVGPNAGTVTRDTIQVSTAGTILKSLRVGLQVDHTWSGDIAAVLLPPGVTWASAPNNPPPTAITLVLFHQAGAGDDFDAFGTNSLTSSWEGTGPTPANPAATGPYGLVAFTIAGDPVYDPSSNVPSIATIADPGDTFALDAAIALADPDAEKMRFLVDSNPQGNWELVLIDFFNGDGGVLQAWELEYTAEAGSPSPEFSILNGGRLALLNEQGTDVPIGDFDLWANGTNNLTSLTLTLNGTLAGAGVTDVRLYRDLGTFGVFEPGTDVLLGGGVSNNFSTGSTAITLTAPLDLSVDPSFLVVASVTGFAGDVFSVSIEQASHVSAGSGANARQVFPVESDEHTLVAPAQITTGTHLQSFEAGNAINWIQRTTGNFPGHSGTLAAGQSGAVTSQNTGPGTTTARVQVIGTTYVGGCATLNFASFNGSQHMVLDWFPSGTFSTGAVDFMYDMSGVPSGATVTLSFVWADQATENHVNDGVFLSRDGGATWDTVLYAWGPAPRPNAPAGAGQPPNAWNVAQNITIPAPHTGDMVIRFQDQDNFQYTCDDGLLIDAVQIDVSVPPPDIEIQRPAGSAIADGGTDAQGSLNAGQATTLTYTIVNTGVTALNLTGGTPVSVANPTNVSASVLAQPGMTTLAQGTSTTFQIQYTVAAAGAFSFEIDVASDDPNENPYDITVSGTGLGPDIDIQRPAGTSIVDAGTDAQGNRTTAVPVTLTYTIANTGSGTLNLTGGSPVSVGNTVNCSASVSLQPAQTTLAAATTTTFQVQYTPTAAGAFSFEIDVASNDPNENPYDVTVSGTAVDPAPEIDVQRPAGTSIADGGSDPQGGQSTGGAFTLTYTIVNTGNATLNLTGGSPVSVGNTVNCSASVTQQPSGTVAAGGGTTTFQVQYSPTIVGVFSFEIDVANDDANENPYDITVSGNGTSAAPEIDIQRPAGTSIADGGTDAQGNIPASVQQTLTYTILNQGGATLNIGGVSVTGQNNVTATVSQQPGTTIATGSQTTFQIQYTVAIAQGFSFTIHVDSDDANEDPYDITVSGTGTFTSGTPSPVLAGPTTFQSPGVGQPLTALWTLTNQGGAALVVTAASVSSTSFSISGLPAMPFTLQPGARIIFQVTFTPASNGQVTAAVTFTSNAGGTPGTTTMTNISGTVIGSGGGSGGGGGGGGGTCAVGETSSATRFVPGILLAWVLLQARRRRRAGL